MFFSTNLSIHRILSNLFLLLSVLTICGNIHLSAQINHCNVGSPAINTTDTVALQLGYVAPYYFELELLNTTSDLMAFEFELSGLQIVSLEALTTEFLDVHLEDGIVSVCAYDGLGPAINFRPVLGVHVIYSASTGPVCAPQEAIFINTLVEQVVYQQAGYCAFLECPEDYDGIDGDVFMGPPCSRFAPTNVETVSSENALNISSIFPIPAKEELTVQFHSKQMDLIDLKVYGLLGKLVEEKTIQVQQGVSRLTLDLRNYVQGNYLMTLSSQHQGMVREQFVVVD